MAFHHIHNQNIRHAQLCCHWQEKPVFRCGLATAVYDPDNDHWSDSPPSGVRRDRRRGSGLITFWPGLLVKARLTYHVNCLSIRLSLPPVRKESVAQLHPAEQRAEFWGCEVSASFTEADSRAEGGDLSQNLSLEGRSRWSGPRRNSQAAGTDSLVKQRGHNAQPRVLLQHRYTLDLVPSTTET